jgi:hypothetical protein
MVEPDTAGDSIIQHMHFSCQITKAADTHGRICSTYCFLTATVDSQMCFNVTFMYALPFL